MQTAYLFSDARRVRQSTHFTKEATIGVAEESSFVFETSYPVAQFQDTRALRHRENGKKRYND